ncbi:SDR family NAD(P)-dependent oxidoreductase [Nocardia ninae]|uniref:Putative short-chain dehydrogenase/reductase n=1 Tax=Nocardia ninae NBRC 108245 TaxID=1210091 RepID=A0A511MIR1_9NOCA|nr:SDR family NAD(P)-dependent oxidoreductase [Nocardia ninae]GEM40513.1 putative short-chain dehydrogenase/reductase [Nocardia ninae NBRC 108245]
MSRKTLTGKRIAITGGAHGIGRETASAFLAEGADLVIGDVDVGAVRAVADQLGRSRDGTVVGLALDVTDSARFGSFLTYAERRLGGLDVVVNAADVMPSGPFLAESEAESDRQIDINLRAVIIGTRLAAERFASQGHGQIVNIGTVGGVTAALGVAVYCATKHGVVGLGAALDQELSGKGVTVSTVASGSLEDPAAVADSVVECVLHGRGGLISVPPTSFLRAALRPPGLVRRVFTRNGR